MKPPSINYPAARAFKDAADALIPLDFATRRRVIYSLAVLFGVVRLQKRPKKMRAPTSRA